MRALLIGLLALVAGQDVPPMSMSSETLMLLERSPAVASPVTGYITVGDYFLKNGESERARQIFAYALLYAPEDPRLLSRLAALQPPPSPASPTSASPAPPSSPATSSSPSPAPTASPTSSTTPTVVSTLPAQLVADLALAVGATSPKALDAISRPPPRLDPGLRGDKLMALGILKSVDAALKIYKLNHPKEELKELDLKKLVDDRALPKELDLTPFPKVALADGKLTMEGFGALDALEGDLAAYREGLEQATRHRERGLLSEAHAALSELEKKFPGDPELLARLLRIQLELKLEFAGAETAKKLFLARPYEPRNLWAVAVLLYRSSRPEKAKEVAQLLPRIYRESFYTPAARALVGLVDSGVSHAQIQKILIERERTRPVEE